MTERGGVRFGDITIDYEVRRSRRRRKTVQITVREGVVHVAAPAATPDGEIRAIVLRRARWILGRLSEEPPRRPLNLDGGGTLPYLGRGAPVTVEPGDVPSTTVHFHEQRFRVTVQGALSGDERRESIRLALAGWYRERAAELLPVIVERWWPVLGRGSRSRLLVGDQRRRWGSCGRDGTLRFSWRVMMLEPDLIDLIVVHELAHLTHRNHSADFWDLVGSAVPDTRQLRRRLREAEPTLPL